MEIAVESTDSLTVEGRMNIDDKELCLFYYKAIKRLLDIDNNANISYLHRYFKIFNEYYDFWCQVKLDLKDGDKDIINLLYDSLYYRIFFVYRNATILSSAVSFHFMNIYKQSPMLIKRLMVKKHVKICSLGGCSASDIVAVVSVLEYIALINGIELDFRVTIIESDERWKVTCITILSCLKQFKMDTWKINFIHGNLSKKNAWTPETLKAIQEADILTAIRVLSKFNHKKKITEMICENMHPQALLFILDRPLTELIELSFAITDSEKFELIHKELCDLHTLDIAAVKYFGKLFQKQFGDSREFRTNTSCNVFISVWMKASPESVIKWQDNLEVIFQNNVEKYKPREIFLCHNDFKRWESLFTKEKEAAGWTGRNIRKIILEEKETRNRLLVEFMNEKKKLDTLQKNLFNKLQLLKKSEEESIETDEDSLDIYLDQKRQYSLIKKTIYYTSFRSHR